MVFSDDANLLLNKIVVVDIEDAIKENESLVMKHFNFEVLTGI